MSSPLNFEQTRRQTLSLAAASAAAAAPWSAWAKKEDRFEDGADFVRLDNPTKPDVAAGQIEVIEFFWYNCPHCNRFEPTLEAWAKKQKPDVVLKRAPVAINPMENFSMPPQQRLYYALEAMGLLDKVHKQVFTAIHEHKVVLDSRKQILEWIPTQGVQLDAFTKTFDSMGVQTKINKVTPTQNAFRLRQVPSLGINGKYYTDGGLAKSMARALDVVDYLVGLERRGAKPAPKAAASPAATKAAPK
jgi:protein dithiol oxidoreductase (disulfide-forming)